MNVTYYAKDMQEALEKIKKELGPDAIIVSSKQVRPKTGIAGLFSKKVYEVVANYEPAAVKKPVPKPNSRPRQGYNLNEFISPPEKITIPNFSAYESVARGIVSNPSANPDNSADVLFEMRNTEEPKNTFAPASFPTKEELALKTVEQKIAEHNKKIMQNGTTAKNLDLVNKESNQDSQMDALDERINDIQEMLFKFSDKFEYIKRDVTHDYSPKIQNILAKLIDNDVEENLAHELCQRVQKVLNKKPDENPREIMAHFLHDVIGDPHTILHKQFERRVIMIVGPTGVGKTTTLVKLVSQIVYKDELKVGVINSDVYRVGAQEQLKNYVEILGIPMITIYDIDDIGRAMTEFDDMDFVFIDTAGKLSNDAEYIEDIKTLIEKAKVDEVYLAVNVATALKTAYKIIDNYSFIRNYYLLLTKADESAQKGAIVNYCKRSGRPISYMTVGQSVPDDIIVVDTNTLILELLR